MSIIKDEKKVLKRLHHDSQGFAKLPMFFKQEDGSWAFAGQAVTIHTIEEYNQYKDVYSEILEFIQQNFKSSIVSIYKRALNSLVDYSGKSQVSDLLTTLSKGKTLTIGKVFSQANSENKIDSISSLRHILNGANAVNGKFNKPFRPYRLSGKGSEYIFPEFTENGVAAKVENKNISVKFKAVDADEAERLKSYMLSCVPGTTEEEKVLQKVVTEYFEYSKHVADLVKTGNASEVYEAFSHFNEMSSYLFETDLSAYRKEKKANDLGLDEFDDEIFANSEEDYVDDLIEEKDDKVVGIDFKTGYKTEPVFGENGAMIRISPVDGSFVVTFNETTKTYVVEQAKEFGNQE